MQRLDNVVGKLKGTGIDLALLCSYENVVYASGFDTPVTGGAGNDMAGGYPLSYVLVNVNSGEAVLLTADFYSALANEQCYLKDYSFFQLYDHFENIDPRAAVVDAVCKLVKSQAPSKCKIGIEKSVMPALLYEHLVLLSSEPLVDITLPLADARVIKTAREIELIKNSVRVNDAGMKAFLDAASNYSGQSELNVWNDVVSAVTLAQGEPVPVFGEIVTGQRTKPLGFLSGPIDRKIVAGEHGMIDLSIRCNGYWADCSNTVIFGKEPTSEQYRYARSVLKAYYAVLDAMKPGVKCSDVDAVAHKTLNAEGFDFIVYTGHQIGCSVNENPRILKYDHTVLQKDMVFCIEPQIYLGDFGAICYRMEKMVRVSDDGVEELSKFNWGIE